MNASLYRMFMTPELELLAHIAKTTLRARDRSAVEVLQARGLDWRQVVRLARLHQVVGFLGVHLNDTDLAIEAPREVRETALRLAEENRVRYTFFIEPELERILETLNRERISVLTLKGTALNRLVYRDLRIRPLGDVDLLIEEHNLPRTRELIDELGYSQNEPASEQPDNPDNYHYCPRLLSPDGSVEIELHRHLVRKSSPLYFGVEELWEHAREKEIKGQRAWILGPIDLVSHLCLKFFVDRSLRQHSYAALRQLADVAETVAFYAEELDWSRLIRQAKSRGHAGAIFCSLHTAKHLLDLEVDADVLDRLRPPSADDRQLRLFVERKLFDTEPWFFHELVDPEENTGWNIAKALCRRLWPESKYLSQKYWDRSDSTGLAGLFALHLKELGSTLPGSAADGRRVSEHLGVDRWMHRILTESR